MSFGCSHECLVHEPAGSAPGHPRFPYLVQIRGDWRKSIRELQRYGEWEDSVFWNDALREVRVRLGETPDE